jgi:hypothetical protein
MGILFDVPTRMVVRPKARSGYINYQRFDAGGLILIWINDRYLNQ